MPVWAQMIAVAGAVATLSPVVSALAIQWRWPSWAKTVLGLLIALATAFAAVAATTGYPSNVGEWAAFLATVILSTQLAYRQLWKPAEIEKLELATSVGGDGL